MLKTDFNKSRYKTLGPVHKGELRSHSPLRRWELGSPDEVEGLELSFAVCPSHLTIQIHSGALFSFLSFTFFQAYYHTSTLCAYHKGVFACITESTSFSSQTLITFSQIFASPKLKIKPNPKTQ